MSYYKKKTRVRNHRRFDPRIGKKVEVNSYNRDQRYKKHETVSKEQAIRRFNQLSEKQKANDKSRTSKKLSEDRFDKLENVAYETDEYWKKIEAISPKLLERIKTIEANKVDVEQFIKKHPEATKDVELTFMYPNEYSRKHPDKCKVLFIDTERAPEVETLPKIGIPGQVINYGGVYYVANDKGKLSLLQLESELIDPKELQKEGFEQVSKSGIRWIKIKIETYTYTRKDGKEVTVPEYDKKIGLWIPKYDFKYGKRKVRGEERFVEFFKHKDKVYMRMLMDKRKDQRITQPTKIKEWTGHKTMKKKIPPNLAKGFKEIAKDRTEHSIMVDFERELTQPQRVAIVQGGETETMPFRDFELFGHTHPHRTDPNPSTADLKGMGYLKPEFIIAGRSGKMIILNIEDMTKNTEWRAKKTTNKGSDWVINNEDLSNLLKRKKYKNDEQAKKVKLYKILKSKKGREMFFDFTGVKVYPYKKTTTIELKDDPHLEKKWMPTVEPEQLEKWKRSNVQEIKTENWKMWINLDKKQMKDHLNELSVAQIKSGSSALLTATEKRQKKEVLIDAVAKKLLKLKTHYEMGPG